MTSALWWLLLLAVVLALIAGLLVSAETALQRVSQARVEEMERDEVRGATRLLVVLNDRARYINVLLFMSTLASVSATVVLTIVFLQVISTTEWLAAVVTILISVVVSYVAIGVAPRTLGRQNADRIALRAAGPARFLAMILGPITTLLILLGNALTPGKGYREGPFETQLELRELVDLAEADSVIEDEERQMIQSVFELGETIAREVMVPRTEMVFIDRDRNLRQALSLGLRSGYSRIPVIGENHDDIVGVVYLKDVMHRVFDERDAEQAETVASLMRPAVFVPDTKQVDELLREMQAARVHLVMVVDEYGGTAGLVTIEDILEEIVGEIADEHDTEAPEVSEISEGAFRVSSRMDVDDFAELVDIDVVGADEGVETVLGLMAKRLGRVPIPGARVEVEGWLLVAEHGAGRRNRIATVLATRIPPEVDND
jgi:CBS domain containing-hemolysin-like protein